MANEQYNTNQQPYQKIHMRVALVRDNARDNMSFHFTSQSKQWQYGQSFWQDLILDACSEQEGTEK